MRAFVFAAASLTLLSGCAYQAVTIRTEPEKADVYVNGALRGRSPVVAKIPVDSFANALGNRHEVMAKMEGYLEERQLLVSNSAFFSNLHPYPEVVTLKLRRAAASAQEDGSEPAPSPRFSETPAVETFPEGEPRPDDVAVIVANADYGRLGRDIPDVTPAYADAEGFRRLARSVLGVREGNIIFLKDATGAQLARVFGTEKDHRGQLFDWVKPGKSKVYVYYAGHGAPSIKGQAFLVPVDADARRMELNGYPLDLLYSNLGRLPAASITVALESCFSGTSQAGTLIPQASPLINAVKASEPPEKITVLSAAAMDQVASWEENKGHSLFTKFLLKGWIGEADNAPGGNEDGQVGWDELERYLRENVTYRARRYYGRDQVPQIRAAR